MQSDRIRQRSDRYLVGAYERLSREDSRSDESSSIESQKMIIESFATFHHLEIIRHYADDGFTGSNFERPAFECLKNDIENGLINCVIVKDLSRLGRELYETGSYIEDYFLTKRVRFIAINDGYDSDVGDEMLGIRLSVNDLYLRDTSKKIRSTFDAKRKKGDYIGSFPKYGYLKDPQNPKHLIVDPHTAPIVIQMFTWASKGMGTSMIAQRLTEKGYCIPSVYKKENRFYAIDRSLHDGKGIWRPQTVKSILVDKIYLGHMIQGKWRKQSYNSKKLLQVPESEWFVVEHTHEAIISQELYDKVQETLKKNKRYSAKKEKRYLFQGLLFCGECGHAITIAEKKAKQGALYYGQCNYYQKYSKYKVCSSHSFNYMILENEILFFLKKIGRRLLDEMDEEVFLQYVMNLKHQERTAMEHQLDLLNQDQRKKQTIVARIYEDRLNEVISMNQYLMMAKKYNDELTEIEEKKEKIIEMMNREEKKHKPADYECYKEKLARFLLFDDPTPELMYQLIDKIIVEKDHCFDVYFRVDAVSYLNRSLEKK